MASNWDTYYAVLLSALLALIIPGALTILSRLLLGSRTNNEQALPEVQFPQVIGSQKAKLNPLGHRLNVRANRSINSAMLFILLTLLLVPYSATEINRNTALSIIVALSFLALALLYAVRKGDFNWTDSFNEKDSS